MEISWTGVVAQIINFWILYFLYNKFFAKNIIKVIEDKKVLFQKLENAEQRYNQKIQEAKTQADKIKQEALDQKNSIINEAWVIAHKKKDEILANTYNEAENILDDANKKANKIKKELEKDYLSNISHMTKLVVKKLIGKEQNIKDAYLTNLLEEVTK